MEFISAVLKSCFNIELKQSCLHAEKAFDTQELAALRLAVQFSPWKDQYRHPLLSRTVQRSRGDTCIMSLEIDLQYLERSTSDEKQSYILRYGEGSTVLTRLTATILIKRADMN